MKKVIIKVTSSLLACLVLFSTFSFTVESHYCGDFLIDVSFTGDSEVCKNDVNANLSLQMKDCCSNEIIKLEGQDELQKVTFIDLDFSKQQFIASFFDIYQDLSIAKISIKKVDQDLNPPDIPQNYQVLHQSFLI